MDAQDASPALPPAKPHRPAAIGETVVDRKTGKLAKYMGEHFGITWLRPVDGGAAVPVHPDGMLPPPADAKSGAAP